MGETAFTITATTADAGFANVAISDVLVFFVVFCFVRLDTRTASSIKRVFVRPAPVTHVLAPLLTICTHIYQQQDNYQL
jgi:hypothetical protein